MEKVLWHATTCGTKDECNANVQLSQMNDVYVRVEVSKHGQSFGPDTALSMAAALIKFALKAKGLYNVKDLSITSKFDVENVPSFTRKKR